MGEKYLKEQIDSLYSQSNVNISILARDDGSKDGTLEILKSYKHKKLILIEGSNIGCAESFRFLLNEAYKVKKSYDAFAFCDQDDIWLPLKLKVAYENLKNLSVEKPSLYCSNLNVVDKNLNFIKLKNEIRFSGYSKQQSLIENIGTGCTMLFNKRVLDFFIKFPPNKLILHDIWIFHTCYFLGEIYYDHNSLILYRQHENNVIGVKTSFFNKLKQKVKTIKSILNQHEKQIEAQNLLDSYGDLLSFSDLRIIKIVAEYKFKWKYRLILLFNPKPFNKMKRINCLENIFFKIRVIIGSV